MENNKITRAINLSLDQQQVADTCRASSLRISAIEPLASGGTHVVLVTIEDADRARHLMRKSIITGKVVRLSFRRSANRKS